MLVGDDIPMIVTCPACKGMAKANPGAPPIDNPSHMLSYEELLELTKGQEDETPFEVYAYLLKTRRIKNVFAEDGQLTSILLEDGSSILLINGKFSGISYK